MPHQRRAWKQPFIQLCCTQDSLQAPAIPNINQLPTSRVMIHIVTTLYSLNQQSYASHTSETFWGHSNTFWIKAKLRGLAFETLHELVSVFHSRLIPLLTQSYHLYFIPVEKVVVLLLTGVSCLPAFANVLSLTQNSPHPGLVFKTLHELLLNLLRFTSRAFSSKKPSLNSLSWATWLALFPE